MGITHRVKQTKSGEARPTLVATRQNGTSKELKLKDEDAELEFIQKDLHPGDTVAMLLGGSGDRFAASLGKQAQRISAKLIRIPPFVLQQQRTVFNAEPSRDHFSLLQIAEEFPHLCYAFREVDRELIWVKETYFARQEAQDARIQCENRIRARLIGRIFLSDEGGFPEGKLADLFDDEKANDKILQALIEEEKLRNRDLKKAVHRLPVWHKVFAPIEGCGETIAAGLVAAIGDIRRFETKAKLKAFCGVHVNEDGGFVRRRTGQVANWHSEARQALYLLADQFNRRPESTWGQKLRGYKAALRSRHPEVVMLNGKKRYTDGHIHKMGMWRTITRFVESLHAEWSKLEH